MNLVYRIHAVLVRVRAIVPDGRFLFLLFLLQKDFPDFKLIGSMLKKNSTAVPQNGKLVALAILV